MKNALAGSFERNAPLRISRVRNALTVRSTSARRLSSLFRCRANWSPRLIDRWMKITPRRSERYGKLPSPLSVRAPSM